MLCCNDCLTPKKEYKPTLTLEIYVTTCYRKIINKIKSSCSPNNGQMFFRFETLSQSNWTGWSCSLGFAQLEVMREDFVGGNSLAFLHICWRKPPCPPFTFSFWPSRWTDLSWHYKIINSHKKIAFYILKSPIKVRWTRTRRQPL